MPKQCKYLLLVALDLRICHKVCSRYRNASEDSKEIGLEVKREKNMFISL
jgi:hypothetical protein